MSIALNPNEKPAPPIRRTPSMNTNCYQQQFNNGYMELQSRLRARLKRAEEVADEVELRNTQQSKTTTVTKLMTQTAMTSQPTAKGDDDDFPLPPPEFLNYNNTDNNNDNNNNSKLSSSPRKIATTHLSLLEEIRRGFKLRKTVINRDRSAPRLK